MRVDISDGSLNTICDPLFRLRVGRRNDVHGEPLGAWFIWRPRRSVPKWEKHGIVMVDVNRYAPLGRTFGFAFSFRPWSWKWTTE
jgi:hypothetical protein